MRIVLATQLDRRLPVRYSLGEFGGKTGNIS